MSVSFALAGGCCCCLACGGTHLSRCRRCLRLWRQRGDRHPGSLRRRAVHRLKDCHHLSPHEQCVGSRGKRKLASCADSGLLEGGGCRSTSDEGELPRLSEVGPTAHPKPGRQARAGPRETRKPKDRSRHGHLEANRHVAAVPHVVPSAGRDESLVSMGAGRRLRYLPY